MPSSLIVGILILAGLIGISVIPKFGEMFSNIILLVLFLFAVPNLDAKLGNYYSIMIISVFILEFVAIFFKITTADTSSALGKANPILAIMIGLITGGIIFTIFSLLQSRSSASIIGVPSLALTLPAQFSPALVGALGFVENRFFINLWYISKSILGKVFISVLSLIPIIGQLVVALSMILAPVLPVFMIAGLFAVFHLTAYSGQVASLIFAMIAGIIFIFSTAITGSTLGADIGHYLWNFTISLGKSLTIVGG